MAVVRAIRTCAGIGSLNEYSAWLSEDLDSLLQHRGWACGLGALRPDGFTATHWLASPGPNEQFADARTTSRSVASPLLTAWFEHRRPQVRVRTDNVAAGAADASGAADAAAADDIFAPRPLGNAVLHCQLDPENKWTSVFAFVNRDEEPGFRERLLLELLVPHLHATLCRVIAPSRLDAGRALHQSIKLTIRELQILRHIRLGRTNGEIAQSLNKSVFTVNNQVVKVLEKLSAKNRTHAVVVARDMGLLDS
jgi:DNA-binding CsgD family transcriptional regulator